MCLLKSPLRFDVFVKYSKVFQRIVMFFFVTIGLFQNYLRSKLVFDCSQSVSSTINPILFEEFTRVLQLKNDTEELHHLPAVLVDLAAFDRNVALLRHQMSFHPNTTIRIASKSLRVPFLLNRILSSGLPFKGLMCFAVEEAQFLSSLGFDDFLIAYPSQQIFDYKILRDLHDREKKVIRIVVDDPASTKELNEFMTGISQPFPVILEFDASFRIFGGNIHIGARRSPLRTIAQLVAMIELIQKLPFLHLEGLMVYESHIAGIGDTNPNNFWLNPFIRYMKYMSISHVKKIREELKQLCYKYSLNLFNGGGTGSLMAALTETTILTEITIGSGFFQSHLFDHYEQNQKMINCFGSTFVPSCYFALPVVRISDEGEWVTCSGGGYMASGRPGWDKAPIPVFPLGLTLNDNEGAGEVQTPLRIDQTRKNETMKFFEQNRLVFFRHAKAGELAERFNFLFIVVDGKTVEITKTYRGYGKCFF